MKQDKKLLHKLILSDLLPSNIIPSSIKHFPCARSLNYHSSVTFPLYCLKILSMLLGCEGCLYFHLFIWAFWTNSNQQDHCAKPQIALLEVSKS